MYDYSALLGRIVEKGYNHKKLAQKLSIAPSSLSLKLNNKREFTQSQMRKMCELLDIYDVESYFFTLKL